MRARRLVAKLGHHARPSGRNFKVLVVAQVAQNFFHARLSITVWMREHFRERGVVLLHWRNTTQCSLGALTSDHMSVKLSCSNISLSVNARLTFEAGLQRLM